MKRQGVFPFTAIIGQEWRATYIVSGVVNPARAAIFFSLRFTSNILFRYCLRSVPSSR